MSVNEPATETSSTTGATSDPPLKKGQGTRGAAITMTFQAVKLVIQILSTLALSRFLGPQEFGLYAMVVPVYVFSLLFQDSGITQAIIQRDEISKADLNNIFYLNFLICFVVVLVLSLLAPAIADFYATPHVTTLIWGFCGVTILNCLSAQPIAIMTRRMSFGFLAALDVASYTLGFVASLVLAIIHPSYWALFAMPLVTAATTLLGAWFGAGWWPGLPAPSSPVRSLIRFGSGVFGFNFLNYFTRNADLILLGKFASAAALGAYDRANRLILFPIQQINIPLGRVFLPMLSRMVGDEAGYRKLYLEGVSAILLIAQPGIVWLICDSAVAIPTILGPNWSETADIFLWMGVAALWQPMTYTAGWLFVSQNRTSAFWKWGLFNAIVSVAGFVVALPWGAIGFAAVYALRENLIRLPVLVWLTGRRGPLTARHMLLGFLPFPFGCLAAAAVVLGRQLLLPHGGVVAISIDLVMAYAAYGVAVLAFPRGRELLMSGLDTARGLRAKAAS
jgi:polysaccharide transporter, PST family